MSVTQYIWGIFHTHCIAGDLVGIAELEGIVYTASNVVRANSGDDEVWLAISGTVGRLPASSDTADTLLAISSTADRLSVISCTAHAHRVHIGQARKD